MEVAPSAPTCSPLCPGHESGRSVLAEKDWVKAMLRDFRRWHQVYRDFRECWGIPFSDSSVDDFNGRVRDVQCRYAPSCSRPTLTGNGKPSGPATRAVGGGGSVTAGTRGRRPAATASPAS